MTSLIYIVEAEYCKLLNVRVPNQVGVSDHLQPILPYFHYKKIDLLTLHQTLVRI